MAISSSNFLFSLHLRLHLLLLALIALTGDCCYTHFFSFGDSINDNGNLLRFSPLVPASKLPYGETFFHQPTGRFCDGKLIVDFISDALHMPYLTPYLVGKTAKDFKYGANFAFAGATALNKAYFNKKGLKSNYLTPYSLGTQIRLFKKLLQLLGSTDAEKMKITESSLFLVGEIGGNDYNLPFLLNRTVEEIRTYVPDVIKAIGASVNDLIELGAKMIIVPGNFPLGCMPRYLTAHQSKNASDYDKYGCLKWLNDFAEYHNTALKAKLEQLRERNSGVIISYADYYGATLSFTKDPKKYGFSNILEACCGAGGPYNAAMFCGLNNGSHVCPNPDNFISWDGLHLTHHAYKIITHHIVEGPYANPPIILTKC